MSDILKFVVYSEEVDPNRFKKLPGEKEQLKDMKKAFFRKHKVANHKLKLTNKQIAKTFAAKVTITT